MRWSMTTPPIWVRPSFLGPLDESQCIGVSIHQYTMPGPLRLPVDPASPVPLWNQIEAAVRRAIDAGALAPGDVLPSVRECATTLKVNPATVSRAYQRLVDAGIAEVRRGEGTFVANGVQAASRARRQRDLRAAADALVAVAVPLGAGLDETVAVLQQAWAAATDRRRVEE